jgi:hypothetical protein
MPHNFYSCTLYTQYKKVKNAVKPSAVNIRVEVLALMRMSVLNAWVVTPCGLVGKYQYSEETYHLHLQS